MKITVINVQIQGNKWAYRLPIKHWAICLSISIDLRNSSQEQMHLSQERMHSSQRRIEYVAVVSYTCKAAMNQFIDNYN